MVNINTIENQMNEIIEEYEVKYGNDYSSRIELDSIYEIISNYEFNNLEINNIIKEKIKDKTYLYQFFIDYFYEDLELMKEIILKDNIYLSVAPKEILLDSNFMINYILNDNDIKYINFRYLDLYKDAIQKKANYEIVQYKALRALNMVSPLFRDSKIISTQVRANLKLLDSIRADKYDEIKINYLVNNPELINRELNKTNKYNFNNSFLRNLEVISYKLVKKNQFLVFCHFLRTIDVSALQNEQILLKTMKKYAKLIKEDFDEKKFENTILKYNKELLEIFDKNLKTSSSIKFKLFPKIYKIIKEDKFKNFFNIFTDLSKEDYELSFIDVDLTAENSEFIKLIANNQSYFDGITLKELNILNEIFINFYNIDTEPNKRINIISNLYKNYRSLINKLNIDELTHENYCNLFKLGEITDFNSTLLGEVKFQHCNDINKFNDWEQYKNKFCDYCTNELVLIDDDYRDLFFNRYFNFSYETACNIYNNLLKNLDTIDNYPILKEFRTIVRKISTSNKEEIINIYNLSVNKNYENYFFDIIKTRQEIKKEYFHELQSNLYIPKKDVNVIELDGREVFNILLHVVDAYGKTTKENLFASWNTENFASNNSICCSYISNENMSTARITSDQNVILGFNNLDDDSLELMSSNDLYSYGFNAFRASIFQYSKDLINNTRLGHNELTIRRKKGLLGNQKIQPSYIVCFDQTNEKSRQAAIDFGIPIVVINREKVLENEQVKLEKIKDTFRKNPSINEIRDIIVKGENNYSGLFMNCKELTQKYFSLEYRQNNLNEIVNIITNLYNEGEKEKSIDLLKELIKTLELETKKREIKHENNNRKNPFKLEFNHLYEMLETFENTFLVRRK